MGVDYSGGMIVGRNAEEISYDDERFEHGHEFLEHYGMECYCKWYDAGTSGQVWGFPISNVELNSEDFQDWLKELNVKAKEFEKITGEKAKLIGMQNIY